MSAASRERERIRLLAADPYVAFRRRLITLDQLRAIQAERLAAWTEPAAVTTERLAWLAATFDGRDLVPMTYPEPPAEDEPQPAELLAAA